MFDESFRRFGRGGREMAFVPPLDVEEEKDAFLISLELPGMKKEDVQVTLQGSVLTIRGEKKQEQKNKEADYYCRECVQGSFQRIIELPATVEAKQIDAKFHDGILTIRLPKSEEAKPKQIEVKVG